MEHKRINKIKIQLSIKHTPCNKVVGPHGTANVLIMRGVFAKFTIPIYYEYDTAMTPDKLNEIIIKIQSFGFHVLGMTCDSASDNRGCANKLGVTEDSPKFPNPSPEYEGEFIYWMFDAVHLIKLIRNHFIDQGKICNE